MARRRMFAKSTVNSARFLTMPGSARLLYYDLGMAADDDGIVEAFSVLRLTGASQADLLILEKKGFVRVLNDELVTYICDWARNNLIKKDRYVPSVYLHLIEGAKNEKTCKGCLETHLEPERNPSGTQAEPQDRLGKDRLGKDRLGEGGENGSAAPPRESERDVLISEGIKESYIDLRIDRAKDYAKAHKRSYSSVLREWWAKDKDSFADPPVKTFDTDEMFNAALEESMKMLSNFSKKQAEGGL